MSYNRANYQDGNFKKLSGYELISLLRRSRVHLDAELLPQPVCLYVVQEDDKIPIASLGNFSLIIGKAKSRKSYFASILTSALYSSKPQLGLISGNLLEANKVVLYFDTEQADFHVKKIGKRIEYLSEKFNPETFRIFNLRRFDTSTRLQLIETAIYSSPNLGVVIIDGVRDLVSAINDEGQATLLINKLLKWTEEKNIHIICVLHQNKTDTNARGVLGTELQNKAEITISIVKEAEGSISSVNSVISREKDFTSFGFSINEEGIPEIAIVPPRKKTEFKGGSPGSAKNSLKYSPENSSSTIPDIKDLPPEFHQGILTEVFKTKNKLKYKELFDQLKKVYLDKDIKIGDSKIKKIITWYNDSTFIKQQGKPRSKDSYYELGVV